MQCIFFVNSELDNVGNIYRSGGGNNFSHSGDGWISTPCKITVPDGFYIISLTSLVYGINDAPFDFVILGIDNSDKFESQCTFNLTANNNVFYPRCTHTFFAQLSAGTYNFAAWSQYARQFNDVEIVALRIK